MGVMSDEVSADDVKHPEDDHHKNQRVDHPSECNEDWLAVWSGVVGASVSSVVDLQPDPEREQPRQCRTGQRAEKKDLEGGLVVEPRAQEAFLTPTVW